jgi:lysine-N-methylase
MMQELLLEAATERAGPDYDGRFRCIGANCEDACCSDWTVLIDRPTYERYQAVGDGPLRVLIAQHVQPLPVDGDASESPQFARIEPSADGRCPFHSSDGLCQIQKELGEGYLSAMCATYPRVVRQVDGREEKALTLSCPEAARVVLLSPDLLAGGEMWDWAAQRGSPYANSLTDGVGDFKSGEGLGAFQELRVFAVRLLRHREFLLWERLLLLGVFVRSAREKVRTTGVGARGELAAAIAEFAAAVDSGQLHAQMGSIPRDLQTQLDFLLQLAGLRLPRKHIGQRYVDTVAAFTQGIGHGPGATMGSLVAGFEAAHDRWFEPFFRANPHILENLLVNLIFRSLFPFGAKSGALHPEPDMEREFALLTVQFALMKGLLIGVAGSRRAEFGADDVVRTVQSAAKHFEHHPMFLDEAYALLMRSGLQDLRGLTMLTRN